MKMKASFPKAFLCVRVALGLVAILLPSSSSASIYTFELGSSPAGIVQASDGNFYGNATAGGANNCGVLFRFETNGTQTLLYTFQGKVDGATPVASLVQGTNSLLYGMAQSGGANNSGAIFDIGTNGAFTSLYSFAAGAKTSSGRFTNADGSSPVSALTLGADGNFYGTTQYGGVNGYGTLFRLTHSGALTLLYTFSNSVDGGTPSAPLLQYTNGLLYGTTTTGGGNGLGTVFQTTISGQIASLYAFTGTNDGNDPQVGLVDGHDGFLYGACSGSNIESGPLHSGNGILFKVDTNGNFVLLYSFTGGITTMSTSGAYNNFDGGYPYALLRGTDGYYFGVAAYGGEDSSGSLFEFSGQPSAFPDFGPILAFFSGVYYVGSGTDGDGCTPWSLIQAKDGTLYGTTLLGGTNNDGTIFSYSVSSNILYPQITGQPVAITNVIAGADVDLTVTASGNPPLYYQWMLNGAPIPNATGNSYQFDAIPSGAATDFVYQVIVSNTYGAAISSNAEVTITRVRTGTALKIATPKAGVRTTNAIISGTVTSTVAITEVTYWITNINNGNITVTSSASATLGANNSWSANPTIEPGTNIVSATAFDADGNESPVVSRSFFYEVPSLFTVTIGDEGGKGTVTGNALPHGKNSSLLDIGESYTVTAKPNSQSLFANWTGSINSTNATLKFVMESGLALEANFVTNWAIAAAGTYSGLFFVSNAVSEQTAGMVKGLVVGRQGGLAGQLFLGGKSFTFTGHFDANANSGVTVLRSPKLGGPVDLQMHMDWNNAEISGSVSGTNEGQWIAGLLAERAVTTRGSAKYTMVMLSPAEPSAVSPPGAGYATISRVNGAVNFIGALADGTSYSQSAPVFADGDVPVFANLYTSTGLLLGWINLQELGANPGVTTLTWIKPASRATLYPQGFTNTLTVNGSDWTNPPAHTPSITLMNDDLEIESTNLQLDFKVAVTNNDSLVKLAGEPTNSLKGSVNSDTGLLQISFKAGRSSETGVGVVLQNQNIGAGYILTKTNAGSLTLQ
jgi:uncharacterized repeat protein (TIGR03803 family)